MDAEALAATRPEGLLPAWQFSQEVLVGRWEVGAAGEDGGIAMMLVMP